MSRDRQQAIIANHQSQTRLTTTAEARAAERKKRSADKAAAAKRQKETVAELASIKNVLAKALADQRRAVKKIRVKKARRGYPTWADYPGGDPR
jgi:hypothetical protein